MIRKMSSYALQNLKYTDLISAQPLFLKMEWGLISDVILFVINVLYFKGMAEIESTWG